MPTNELPKQWPSLAGLISGAAGLAFGELVASIMGARGAVVTVGNRFIDGVPRPVKTWAVRTFGTNDKAALLLGVLAVIGIFSALAGHLAARRFRNGLVVVALFGLAGGAAALTARDRESADFVPIISALIVSALMLWLLIRRPQRAVSGATTASTLVNRRQFLVLGGGASAATAAAFLGSRAVVNDPSKNAAPLPARRTVSVDTATSTEVGPAPSTEAGAEAAASRAATSPMVDVPNMTPFVTPNEKFYRIDTALVVPRLDAKSWKMRVTGMVENELTITYDEIRNGRFGPLIDHDCTLMCVSNEVGGELIGNARWTGVPLRAVLDESGVKPEADQIFGRSVEGFTAGFPKELAFDGRMAMLAIGMNGVPLPARNGFPVRLVVPGIYGYVSAVKWLEEIKLTTFEADQGYWIPRGWSALGPIKTSSRIDVVGTDGRVNSVKTGKVPIAGVAWAQHTGIAKVEVRIDGGTWQTAELAADGGIDTWRQWKLVWDAPVGAHTIEVRATDRTGFRQSATNVGVAPNGAEGYHSVQVRVSA